MIVLSPLVTLQISPNIFSALSRDANQCMESGRSSFNWYDTRTYSFNRQHLRTIRQRLADGFIIAI